MGTTKLAVFNAALRELGLREVSDTGEQIESARVLVSAWDKTVKYCLEAGQWNFATRAVKVVADTGNITPSWGFSKVFAKPTDWVRTTALTADEYGYTPLDDLQYRDENEVWISDINPIYVRYVSDDTGYGYELAKWPESFSRYAELELAYRVVERLTQNASKKEELMKDIKKEKRNALNKDAMNSGGKVMPAGRLVTAKSGDDTRERGSRSRLFG